MFLKKLELLFYILFAQSVVTLVFFFFFLSEVVTLLKTFLSSASKAPKM